METARIVLRRLVNGRTPILFLQTGGLDSTDGETVFLHACRMGLEGIVAKWRDAPYRSGRCADWIKIKNMAHPAIERAMLIALSKRARR